MLSQSEVLPHYHSLRKVIGPHTKFSKQVQTVRQKQRKSSFTFDLERSTLSHFFPHFLLHLSKLLREVVYFDSVNKTSFLILNWHQLSLILSQLDHKKHSTLGSLLCLEKSLWQRLELFKILMQCMKKAAKFH